MKNDGPSTAPAAPESSLRLAFVLALTISMAAAATLFQSNVDPDPASQATRGNGSGNGGPQVFDEQTGTPTPLPTPRPRSQAVISAPDQNANEVPVGAPPFPSLGRYVYEVEGSEQGSFLGGGSRSYPSEMRMTVHRSPAGTGGRLQSDELAFDLDFSPSHQEREVVAYRKDGIHFTFESWSINFGATSFVNEGTYEPSMLQIPIPLDQGTDHDGRTVVDTSEGNQSRVEDWSVEVERTDRIFALGEQLDTWVVRVERSTRSGSDEPVTRTRTYWLSPERSIWVKWEETWSTSQGSGLGRSNYSTTYTATLDRIEPL